MVGPTESEPNCGWPGSWAHTGVKSGELVCAVWGVRAAVVVVCVGRVVGLFVGAAVEAADCCACARDVLVCVGAGVHSAVVASVAVVAVVWDWVVCWVAVVLG